MKVKNLCNFEGDDSISNRQIVNGNVSNILNLSEVKYSWAISLYNKMRENFWNPDKVDLTKDWLSYKQLTDEERETFKVTLGFLIFLDSIQTNNIPINFIPYITAPEVVILLTEQASQEALHSDTYQHILESITTPDETNEVYRLFKSHENLKFRCEKIVKVYQDFQNNPNIENFLKALIANYILEGIYFYTSFLFFYSLSQRGLMMGVADEIKYINTDELLHIVIFQNILADFNLAPYESLIYELFEDAVSEEIKFSHFAFAHHIGFDKDDLTSYIKHRANKLIVNIGLKKDYFGVQKNKYKHLESISDSEKNGDSKNNFFESTNTSYLQADTMNWDF